MNHYYRSKKTGKLYYGGETAIDTTNATDGRVMVIYQKVEKPDQYFVREITEFNSKFEMVVEG